MRTISKNLHQNQELIRWFIVFRLKNGLEKCYPISAAEKGRLWSILPRICGQKGIDFVEFNSEAHRILIESSQLIFFQFLFEPPCIPYSQDSDEDKNDPDSYAIKIYCVDDSNPMVFYVDIDEPDPNDEGNQGEMNNFLFYASHVCDAEEWLNFTTEDGETAFFRGANIALAEIPLKVLQEEDFCEELHAQKGAHACSVH